MRLMTNKVRLRIDLALAQVEEPPSAEATPTRRQPLALPSRAWSSDRGRPTLLAPERDRLTRSGSSGVPVS